MTISAIEAAKVLGKLSNWSLSNLKLQKILYLAHMIYTGKRSEPLINENFEAWDYGPVVPSLYHRFKFYGSDTINSICFRNVDDISEDSPEYRTLKAGIESLSKATPGQLVRYTHRKDGAWDINYCPGVKGLSIPTKDIVNEFKSYHG